MGNLFYLLGAILAGTTGYLHYTWLFIFVASLIMATGWAIIRRPQIVNLYYQDGIKGLLKMAMIQVIMYSAITTPLYFLCKAIG